ncbi:hypothetical protein ACM26V_09585 [Salipaludibacillus sp. HK11]|uniref:hypothetical protein n=1 Tax=Salipaludibacillus sp. HK11 TaxID=3394320 RepID=UPI0039FD083A
MKLTVDDLPEKEREIYYVIQNLPILEKRVLWKLIRLSNKDHICLVDHLTPSIHTLINKQLVSINNTYKSRTKTSLFILRRSPFLMKKLQVLGQND